MSNFLRSSDKTEKKGSNKTRKGLALGLVSASLFTAGCGQTAGNSAESAKARSGNVPATKNEKQSNKAKQNVGGAALNGCDLKQAKTFLKARIQDGKGFETYVIKRDSDSTTIQSFPLPESNPKPVISEPLLIVCEADGKKQFTATAGVVYPLKIDYRGKPKQPKPNTYPLLMSSASEAEVTALKNNGADYLKNPDEVGIKVAKEEIHFNYDFGKKNGAPDKKAFSDADGDAYGVSFEVTVPKGDRPVPTALILDMNALLNK